MNASGSGSASYASITMSPVGGTARTISGATTAVSPMIDLNGADNVTINGLKTGGNSLTISNLTIGGTGTSTIRFINGATNNTITNCDLQGARNMSANASAGGTVFFSTDAVTANGNDNNTISNNNIGPAGANLPTAGVGCTGSTTTTATGNSGLIINNNNIFDYFGPDVNSGGVVFNGGCNGSSITNNRFYQTGTRTFTLGGEHIGIRLQNFQIPTGIQAMTVTGNTIGYASNVQTGVYTLVGGNSVFAGIRLSGITNGRLVSTISNNTIASVSMTGGTANGPAGGTPFCGISIANGVADSHNNTIGSQTSPNSLTFSTTTTFHTDVVGIGNFEFEFVEFRQQYRRRDLGNQFGLWHNNAFRHDGQHGQRELLECGV